MRCLLLVIPLLFLHCGKTGLTPDQRAEKIGIRLRCPVCRGVPIAESPSTLAQEMMGIVREQLAQGRSDEEILKYFEERYGEWVLLEPKSVGLNWLLWLLPGLLLVGAGVVLLRMGREKTRRDSC